MIFPLRATPDYVWVCIFNDERGNYIAWVDTPGQGWLPFLSISIKRAVWMSIGISLSFCRIPMSGVRGQRCHSIPWFVPSLNVFFSFMEERLCMSPCHRGSRRLDTNLGPTARRKSRRFHTLMRMCMQLWSTDPHAHMQATLQHTEQVSAKKSG